MKALLHRIAARAQAAPRRATLIAQTLRLVWAASARWTLAWFGLLVGLGLMPAVAVALTKRLTDHLVGLLAAGGSDPQQLRQTLAVALLMAAALAAQQALQSALAWVGATQTELIQDHLRGLVHRQAIHADLAFFESAEYNDRLYQAAKELTSRPPALLESLGGLVQSGIATLALGSLILPYGLWLPLALALAALPGFWGATLANRRFHRWWQAHTTDRRRLQYNDTLLTVDSVASELRLFDLGPHLIARYRGLRDRLRGEQLRLVRDQSLAHFGAWLVTAAVSAAAMLWMLRRALLGMASLGDLVLFYQTLSRGQTALQGLAGSLSQIQRHSLYLQNLFEFLALQPQVTDAADPAPPSPRAAGEVRFHNLTFGYPGSSRPVFENFNLTLPAGKITALVGFNGAGKTTLVKLLCRFYDPKGGRIEIDGVDIRRMRLADLRRLLSCMFQFPVPYVATVAENIAYGDPARPPDPAAIRRAARAAGVDAFAEQLPHQYETLLGKLFPEGVQLSGGEWQRLALARAFYRQGQLLVLDEPTSLMDLWTEVDWFERLRRLAAGRTTLLITHRFMTAMRADLICVLDGGRIVESGTHQALLARGGLYAQAWHDQRAGETTATPPTHDPMPGNLQPVLPSL
ncbi:MAG: ABC transporter ATP-binding protein [Caldilineaceae bacterium]|nr:ABC transporter ATP-binding protein [Caldilineaceae bacterium]